MNELTVWITYYSAGSLYGGGLERCSVWFTKPKFHFFFKEEEWDEQELPFGPPYSERRGIRPVGWAADPFTRGETRNISFGKVFGYESPFAIHVWDALCKHFASDSLFQWPDIEKEGKALPENFCLELKLKIQL